MSKKKNDITVSIGKDDTSIKLSFEDKELAKETEEKKSDDQEDEGNAEGNVEEDVEGDVEENVEEQEDEKEEEYGKEGKTESSNVDKENQEKEKEKPRKGQGKNDRGDLAKVETDRHEKDIGSFFERLDLTEGDEVETAEPVPETAATTVTTVATAAAVAAARVPQPSVAVITAVEIEGVEAPLQIGCTPRVISEAITYTTVVHQSKHTTVRDEYAAGPKRTLCRSIFWMDEKSSHAVQYVIRCDFSTAACRVAKYFASASQPHPSLQYDRSVVALSEVTAKFGAPGAAAMHLLSTEATKRKRDVGAAAQFAMPFIVKGPDATWWHVMMPVNVTHQSDLRDVVRLWGGPSSIEDATHLAATQRRVWGGPPLPPKRIGQQPSTISYANSKTSVVHRSEDEWVRDDYARLDARTIARSISWRSSSETANEHVQYILRVDLIDAVAQVTKFYVMPGASETASPLMDWDDDDMSLMEVHRRFGPPGAAAAALLTDPESEHDTLSITSAVPASVATINNESIPVAYTIGRVQQQTARAIMNIA